MTSIMDVGFNLTTVGGTAFDGRTAVLALCRANGVHELADFHLEPVALAGQ